MHRAGLIAAGFGLLFLLGGPAHRPAPVRTPAASAAVPADLRATISRDHARSDLRADYGDSSIGLTGSGWTGSLGLGRVGRVGRAGGLVPVVGAVRRGAGGARYGTPGLSESFDAVPGGIEQTFTLTARPRGSGPLRVEVPVSGLRVTGAGGKILLRESGGRAVGSYSGLRVTDAQGNVLRAAMRPSSGGHAIVLSVVDADARYPLLIDPLWAQVAELTASNGATSDQFGTTVAVSGPIAVVGAPFAHGGQGEAYVYTFSGGVWAETQDLLAPDASVSSRFGNSVAVSGTTIVVGSPLAAGGLGAVYVWTLAGGILSAPVEQMGANDDFGESVATNGGTVVVGADAHSVGVGLASVFTYAAGSLVKVADLVPADVDIQDRMGETVSISPSGSTIAAGGFKNTFSAVYIFAKSGGSWSGPVEFNDSQDAIFVPMSVAASDTAVVGGAQYASAAYVYTPTGGGGWAQTATLTPPGPSLAGRGVAISGNTIVVGAAGPDSNRGAAYPYVLTGGSWVQQPPLIASDRAQEDEFGFSVAIDGTTIVVGAEGRNGETGAAYVFGPDVLQSGSVYKVNTTVDSNAGCYVTLCSLRDAITAANAHPNGGSPD